MPIANNPIPKLQSKEANADGRPINLPGIYTHKDTGAIFITSDGDEGIAQADALNSPTWEHAWERTGDVPTRLEVLEMRKAQETKEAALIEADKKEEKPKADK